MKLKLISTHKNFGGHTQFWFHESLETKTLMRFSTFLPEGTPRGCLIWLSGLGCTEENFITKAGAQRFLSQHNLMVICPDTSPRGLNLLGEHDSEDFGSGAGFYLDATTPGYRDHYRMYSYVTKELYGLVQDQFGIHSKNISMMGHSMGGHGALIMGLREPEKFRSVSVFAPVSHPSQRSWIKNPLEGYLGKDQALWRRFDATELILAGMKHPVPILVDQGLSDDLLESRLQTQHFIEACRSQSQPLIVNMREGYDHAYYFISTFIDEHIAFHSERIN